MAILELLTIDTDIDGILRKVAESVAPEEIDSLQELIDDMFETMNSIGAVGLAAPQVGVSKRLFVMRDDIVCINPSSCMGSGRVKSHSEGCLSVPGKFYTIKRIRNVIIRCLDRHGQPQKLKPAKKLHAIAIQHEIDHLNGRLISDKGKEI